MKKQFIFLALILMSYSTNAQQNYSFSYFNDTYSDLTGSTVLNDSTWDDPGFEIPIGFGFPFYDSIYTKIVINPLGYGSSLTPTNYVPINSNNPQPIILPISTDLIDRGYNTTTWNQDANTLSPISYLTEGNTGNHILKIEYKNAGYYDELDNYSVSNDFINFQIWLYENGDIEFRYGAKHDTSLYSTNIGIYPFYDYLNTVPTQVGMEISSTNNFSMNSPIANIGMSTPNLNINVNNGMVYKFSSSFVSVNEISSNFDISIYPNPVSTELRFNYNDKIVLNKIIIIDINGKIVKNITNFHNNTIDISDLKTGVYIVKFNSNKGLVTKKIVVQA